MWQGRGRCGHVKEGKNRRSECLPPSMSELKPGPRPRDGSKDGEERYKRDL